MQAILISYKKKLRKFLLEERQQWFLWIPVFYGIGILIYLSLPFEPALYQSIGSTALLPALMFRARKHPVFYYIFFIFFLISAGFMGANLRALYVKAPTLEKPLHIISLQGRVEEIDSYKKFHRIILSNIKTDEIPATQIPNKIRLTVMTKIGDAKAGDFVELRASLSPPQKAVLPETYNFAQDAYFQRIGAVGFSVTDLTKVTQAENIFSDKIQQVRSTIAGRLVNSVGGTEAEIAKALFMGDQGGIGQTTMAAIRNSGLAHLLSISGLHMVIVCTIFFKLSRILLTFFPPIALRYNTKKIAALCAIIGSFLYLLISGNPVPAMRSFIMSSIVLTAIMFDRYGTPLRVVAIAALYILITTPESIISPSFQMSFGAVISLLAAFEWLNPHLKNFASERHIPKIFMSILTTIISSIVATIATAPFAIYHFSRNSPYGVFANILAIPITSFITMPLGMVSIILMPFHLEGLLSWPLKASIDFVMGIATYFSSLPYAGTTIPAINNWQLLLISFGFLWLVIWQTKWRLLGLALAFIAIISAPLNKSPDIIISEDANLFAVKDENGDFIFSSGNAGRYARSVWSARIGQEETKTIVESGSKLINCDTAGCNYKNHGYRASFIKHPIALESECPDSDLFINLTGIKYNCTIATKQLNLYNLKKYGTHEIFLENGITIKTVSGGQHRIWD